MPQSQPGETQYVTIYASFPHHDQHYNVGPAGISVIVAGYGSVTVTNAHGQDDPYKEIFPKPQVNVALPGGNAGVATYSLDSDGEYSRWSFTGTVPASCWGSQNITVTHTDSFHAGNPQFNKMISIPIVCDDIVSNVVVSSAPTLVYIPIPITPANIPGADVNIEGTASAGASGIAVVEWSLDSGPWTSAVNISGDWSQWTTAGAIKLTSVGWHTIAIRSRNKSDSYSGVETLSVRSVTAIELRNTTSDLTTVIVPMGSPTGSVTLTGTVTSAFPIDYFEWALEIADTPTVFTRFDASAGTGWSVTIPEIGARNNVGTLRTDTQTIIIRATDTAAPPNVGAFSTSFYFTEEI